MFAGKNAFPAAGHFVLFMLAVLFFSLQPLSAKSEKDSLCSWHVVKVINDVQVKLPGGEEWYPVKTGNTVREWMTIKTGPKSSALLFIEGLGNKDSYTQIFENTELKVIKLSKNNLDQLDDVYLDLILGEVLVNVENLPQKSNFRVKTPTGLAGIRGTCFSLKVIDHINSVISVLRGKVNIQNFNKDGTFFDEAELVQEGKQLNLILHQKPGEPEAMESRKLKDMEDLVEVIRTEIKDLIEAAGVDEIKIRKEKDKEEKEKEGRQEEVKKEESEREKEKVEEANSEETKTENDDEQTPPAEEGLQSEDQVADEPPSGGDGSDLGSGSDNSQTAVNDGGSGTGVTTNSFAEAYDIITETSPSVSDIIPQVNVDTLVTSIPSHGEPLNIVTSFLSSGSEGTPYSNTLSATGGIAPYSWSLTEGGLPSGLTLNTGGVISGTPGMNTAQASAYSFTVRVLDSTGNTAIKNLTLKISGFVEGSGWNPVVATGETGAVYTNGFGDSVNTFVMSMAVFNNKLYAGTRKESTPGEVWSSADGIVWNQINSDGFGDIANFQITSLGVFNGALYAGTFNAGTYTEVWRTLDGVNWAQVNVNGFGSMNTAVYAFSVFDNCIYAGTASMGGGCQLWRSPDGTTWTQVISDGFAPSTNTQIRSLVVYNNYLYAGTANTGAGSELWRSPDGTTWTQVNTNGFGKGADNAYILSLNVFKGALYAGTYNTITGGEVWRSVDGTTWTQVNANGFGNIDNVAVYSLEVFQNNLFAGIRNFTNGCELWKTSDGITWSQESSGGFGTNINQGVYCLKAFDNYLYAGTENSTGCQLWRFYTEYLDPLITGRVYDSSTGESVDSALVSIYEYQKASSPIQTSNTNPYRVNVDDGVFYFRVEKEGYVFPSNTVTSRTNGDHGECFAATGNEMTIDLAMDPGYPLEIIKTASRKTATVGEILTFNIALRNRSALSCSAIEIRDTLTNGFKMVEGSVYLGTEPLDASKLNYGSGGYNSENLKALSIPITEIPGLKTVNLSYQVRVGVGMEPGEYTTKAYAWNSLKNWRMSEDSTCQVDIEEDPLFTESTLIGKVFNDKNGNGIQDYGEEGVGHVRLATENGVVIITDSNGKFHVADMAPGTHSLKVDIKSMPLKSGNEKSVFTTENPKVFTATEGSIVKVNFGIKLPEEITLENKTAKTQQESQNRDFQGKEPQNEKYFFITALGEGVGRDLTTKGNIEMVEESDKFDDGFSMDGKFAMYLTGKVKGKYLITASIDTERSPEKNNLFRNLDPDKYYPIYGDGSQVNYEANNTQDELFLMVQWDESMFRWGSFNTEIPLYNRTLHGAQLVYKSVSKTKFGQPYTEINAFGARAFQASAHDELLATGGGLYYLKEKDIVEGSEKLRVDIKDPVTREVLGSYPLIEEKDYYMDYDTGRILLTKALSSYSFTYQQGIISNGLQRGGMTYLVADYEYKTFSSLKRDSYGIKGSQHLGDRIKVGGTYVEQDKETSKYKLGGGEVELRLNETSALTADYHKTHETQMMNNRSIDGGLTSSSQSDNLSNGKSGETLNMKAETRLFDNTDIRASYSDQGQDFSATGNTALNGSKTLTGEIVNRPLQNLTFGIKHTKQDSEVNPDLYIYEENSVATTTGSADYRHDKWDYRLEHQHQETEREIEQFTWTGTRQLRDADITGARIGYQWNDRIHLYGGGQVTVNGYSNNQGFAGANLLLWDKTQVSVRETVGNRGKATALDFVKQRSKDTEESLGMQSGRDSRGEHFMTMSQGMGTKISENNKMYAKEDYSSYQSRMMTNHTTGLESRFSELLKMDIRYEHSDVTDEPDAINRNAGGIGIKFDAHEDFSLSMDAEIRKDSGSAERMQYVTQNTGLWKINDGNELSLRLNYSITDNEAMEDPEAEFTESGIGYSLRPVSWDSLNFITKYSYITNRNPLNNNDLSMAVEDVRHVISLEGIYDLNEYFQLAGKTAYRMLKEKAYPRDWVSSDTTLNILRLNYHFIKKWEAGLEYRILANKQIEDSKKGWLLEIDREIGEYFRLGVGYNFTDYSDDLRYDDDYSAEGWFFRVVGKY